MTRCSFVSPGFGTRGHAARAIGRRAPHVMATALVLLSCWCVSGCNMLEQTAEEKEEAALKHFEGFAQPAARTAVSLKRNYKKGEIIRAEDVDAIKPGERFREDAVPAEAVPGVRVQRDIKAGEVVVNANLSENRDAVFATRDIDKGTMIGAGDLEKRFLADVILPDTAVRAPESVAGRRAAENISAGVVIMESNLEPREPVAQKSPPK